MEYFVMSVKEKILNFLSKDGGYNTLTVAQARARFGISNVSARIDELRKEGHAIYTNTKTLEDGRKVTFYRLGTPSKRVIAAGVMAMRGAGYNAFA
jgi:predicted ArsR family transcriptional regulator